MTTPARLPSAFHALHGAMQIVVAFPVNEKRIGARLGKLLQIKIRVRNHQMSFQGQARHGPQRLYYHRPHRNIGHEVSIHDIHMDPVSPGLLRLRHLIAQSGKISGENGRGKFDVHIQNPSGSQFSDR